MSEFENRPSLGSPQDQVVVVGAGIGGLSSAIELAKLGENVTILEKRAQNRLVQVGQERSEITLATAITAYNADSSVTSAIKHVRFVHLDNPSISVSHDIPNGGLANPTAMFAIDHKLFLKSLLNTASMYPNITFRGGVEVVNFNEFGANGDVGVSLRENGVKSRENLRVKAVVSATGPGWQSLKFANKVRQEVYDNSIVAFAYGKRCKGRILDEKSDAYLLQGFSEKGSGKNSWVTSAGDGTIEIVFSDYVYRNEVGKVPRELGYQSFVEKLVKGGYIEIEEEGPVISGYFGLETAQGVKTGWNHIYPYGEKGQYNAPTVGDAIAPTVRNAPKLAMAIHDGLTTNQYEKSIKGTFPYIREDAYTRARMKSSNLGKELGMVEMLRDQSLEKQASFTQNHDMSYLFYLKALVLHPELAYIFGGTLKEMALTFVEKTKRLFK